MSTEAHDDFESEAQPGLPEALPEGERLLWQGQPDSWLLAVHAFHVRKVMLYFALLGLWELGSGLHDGLLLSAIAVGLGKLALAAGLAVGLLLLLARASAREAIYSLTDKRLVMRFGMALRLTLNLPYSRIESAGLRLLNGGHGDIAVRLEPESQVSYAVLWPHARAWRLRRPEPTLRCVPDAERAVRLMSTALGGVSTDRPAIAAQSLSPLGAAS
jgi:hypothetical protein